MLHFIALLSGSNAKVKLATTFFNFGSKHKICPHLEISMKMGCWLKAVWSTPQLGFVTPK